MNTHKSGLRGSFRSAKIKAVNPQKNSVRMEFGEVADIRAELDIELDLWFKQNHGKVNELLQQYGVIRFRGFNSTRLQDFIRFKTVAFDRPMDYTDASSPRTEIDKQVYTSTDYPAEESIHMHCELSYSHNWPAKLAFFCEKPAESGGATMVADTRKVLHSLPEAIQNKFRRYGVHYCRFLTEEAGLSWTQVFGTDDKRRVEEYCCRNDIDFKWETENSLRIEWNRPAIRRHPVTKEEVWFNHSSFFHKLALPSIVRDVISEKDLPFSTCYGDGSVISPDEFSEIRKAYDSSLFDVVWEEGDVLFVDNLLMAHGRRSFKGTRKVRVSMGDPMSDRNFN